MLKYISLALLVVAVSADVVTFKDCANKEVTKIAVVGCSGTVCDLYRNEEVTIEVDFTSNQDTTSAKIETKAKVGEIVFDLPSLDTDACHYTTCPFKKSEKKKVIYKLTVPATTPLVEADVTIKVMGDKGPLLCATVHGSIKE